jgi:hypothetical protein
MRIRTRPGCESGSIVRGRKGPKAIQETDLVWRDSAKERLPRAQTGSASRIAIEQLAWWKFAPRERHDRISELAALEWRHVRA